MLEVAFINARQHCQTPFADCNHVRQKQSNGCLQIGSSESIGNSLVIEDDRIAERQLTIEQIEANGVTSIRITNLGHSIMLADGKRILRGTTQIEALPIQFRVGSTCFRVFDSEIATKETRDKVSATIRTLPKQGGDNESPVNESNNVDSLGIAPSSTTLQQWFESLGKLQRSIAGSSQYYSDAAFAVFDPGGLDAGMLLLREQKSDSDDWTIAGSFVPDPDVSFSFDREVLKRMLQAGRTVFHDAGQLRAGDLQPGQSVQVASPIFDENDGIIGAVYGQRMHHPGNNRCGIRPLEAQFIQLLADSVSAGMMRLQREAKAARDQVMFEQVFSPKVARELQCNPRILDGHQRDVTVLFADLRGFTAIAERLSAKETYHLLGDVMDCLTSQVVKHDGVVIDYFGDGMSAFWNAPLDQPNHPLLACQAGLDMLSEFPSVSDDWLSVIGHSLRIGIGIHTGPALVGNSGSNRRLKYGPRGSTVNLASRIETATSEHGAPLLVSESTSQSICDSLFTRRVGRAQLKGIEKSVDLFEVFGTETSASRIESIRLYERALAAFDASNFDVADQLLAESEAIHSDRVSTHLRSVLKERLHLSDVSSDFA